MAQPKLIIFDCDGVLVDSEPLACRLEMALLDGLGHPIGAEEFRRRAVGRSRKDVNAMLEAFWGRALPADYTERIRTATFAAFGTALQPIPGIRALLESLGAQPRCVASSGHPTRIARALATTDLAEFFGDHVFSAVEVARGKPAPDLFLHAAARMALTPSNCLVVEDSLPGIQAAKAAGMRAIGFTAGGHCEPGHGGQLTAAGADAIAADAAALDALIAAWLSESSPY